jgi:hypothetical protein
MRLVAALGQADVIAQVLRCLGLPTDPPVVAKARPPPQAEFAFPDPTWDP